jgi:regulator of chromosome condensation (RCC1) repeat-containing protein
VLLAGAPAPGAAAATPEAEKPAATSAAEGPAARPAVAGSAAEPGATWAAVAFGDYGPFCGIRDDRSLWCWDPGSTDRRTPARISGSWAAVDRSGQHTCGIRTDGSLWCWGAAGQGRLGGAVAADQPAPMRVRPDARWIAVSAGTTHTCGIQSDHSPWCWGSNAERQLGATFPVRRRIPVPAGTGTSQFPRRPVR